MTYFFDPKEEELDFLHFLRPLFSPYETFLSFSNYTPSLRLQILHSPDLREFVFFRAKS